MKCQPRLLLPTTAILNSNCWSWNDGSFDYLLLSTARNVKSAKKLAFAYPKGLARLPVTCYRDQITHAFERHFRAIHQSSQAV